MWLFAAETSVQRPMICFCVFHWKVKKGHISPCIWFVWVATSLEIDDCFGTVAQKQSKHTMQEYEYVYK